MADLKISNLSVKLGQRELIKNLNLDFSKGSFNALVGPNGAGKSTLLRSIANLDMKISGNIFYEGKNLHSLDILQMSKTLSYMSQFSNVPDLSVWDILALGRRAYSPIRLSKKDHEMIEDMAKTMNILPWLEISMKNLSGGERQKVFILSALLQEPKILLLDEPISHLDPKNQHFMLEFIKQETKSKNLITIIVLHDIHHALHYASDIIMLKDGLCLGKKSSKGVQKEDIVKLFDMSVEMYEINHHKFIYYKHTHS